MKAESNLKDQVIPGPLIFPIEDYSDNLEAIS